MIVENALDDEQEDEQMHLKFTQMRHKMLPPIERPKSVKVGKLNLVDLAGSERVHVTGEPAPLRPAATPHGTRRVDECLMSSG